MASVDDGTGNAFASTIRYTTAADRVAGEGHRPDEFPRGRVDPPPDPDAELVREGGRKHGKGSDPRPIDTQVVADAQGTRMAEAGHPVAARPERKSRHLIRRVVVWSLVLAAIGAGLYYGIRALRWSLDTVSTDDAFVAGHVTYVSPRVEGLVTEVMVDRNDRVQRGEVLARIDREPFVIALAQAESARGQARAQLDQAKAQVRAQLAQARASFFQRRNRQEQLGSQVRSLEAQVAVLRARQSSQHLAELDHRRVKELVTRGSATQSELDQRNNTLDNANQQVTQAWTTIQETRAALGLGPEYDRPQEVPKDILQRQSGVETAVSDIVSSLAQVGVSFDARDIKPGAAFEQIINLDTSQGLDNAFNHVIDQAPAVKVAQAAVTTAEQDLANANLRLSWTEVRSEIDGFVQDRSTNPGNRVEPGDNLMSVRPDYVWIDANYKETQLHDIRIGLPVDLYVDAYPGEVFRGRVSGFLPGTGLSESLLPPENATGNYIKVTQRLAVRIDLTATPPADKPLFVGLSVVPYIHWKEPATGADAGARVHPAAYRQHPDAGGGPAGRQLQNRVEADAHRVDDASGPKGARP